MSQRALLLFLLTPLAGCPSPPPAPPVSSAPTLNKPPLDDRAYRVLKLDNGMTVLLIADADTDTAAAALNVSVGQFQDPPDREGLAHFLEHMLFMGTDEYPGVDEYKEYISTHGGGSNAATGQESTNYYFTIEQAHLEGALDRFARFFVAPKLAPEQVERERNAVNSEYRLKIRDEARRIREVRRESSNPEHGFAKFSVGNLDTLADREGDLVWDDLKAFYEAEYSASRMTLSVFGRQDLDTLEQWVRDRFAAVPSNGKAAPEQTAPIYQDGQQGVKISWSPITDKRELRIELPIPTWEEHFESKPTRVLTSLLGQEGEGSLHAALTERGWITSLYAGLDGASDHGLLTVTTALTEEGYGHVDEIIGMHFQYIRLIQAEEDLSPWWEELKTLSELSFAYAESARPRNAVNAAASSLQHYPSEHVLDAWATWTAYDPALQARFLDGLSPNQARIFVAGPGLETDRVEPLYDVAWSMAPLDPALIESWSSSPIDAALTLPALNPYVAEDTTLEASDGAPGIPTQIVSEDGLSVWHLLDASYGVPRAAISARLIAPAATGSLEARLKASMLAAVLRDAMNTDLDQLRNAGLSVSVGSGDEGLSLSIRGYDDKQDVALDRVLAVLAERPIDPERFAVLQESWLRGWRNSTQDRPNSQAGRALSWALYPDSDTMLDRADALETLTVEELQAFSETVFAQLSVEVLVHGNHTAEAAEDLARRIPAALRPTSTAPRGPAVIRKMPDRELVLDITVDHDDSALRVLYQAEETTITEQARYLMLSNLMETPYFSTIRTEQQLGYIAFAGYQRAERLPGIQMGVQSSVADAQTLLARVDGFLVDYEAQLEGLDAETYAASRDALITLLQEAPSDLYDHTSELERDLSLGFEAFDRKAQLTAALAEVSQADVLALYRERFRAEGAPRLVIRAIGHAHEEVVFEEPGLGSVGALIGEISETVERPRK